MTRNGERGSSLVEFTLAGIPTIFVLIATFEMAWGMWLYHTLAYAVKEATRYAIVHGQNCGKAPNACQITVAQLAGRLHSAATGLIPAQMNVTLAAGGTSMTCRLDECLGNVAVWPAAPSNNVGNDIEISATYPFNSVITFFWPGVRGSGMRPGTFLLTAASREQIQF